MKLAARQHGKLETLRLYRPRQEFLSLNANTIVYIVTEFKPQ